ncbi:hypothetical protein UFOVP833_39 [uncultured Caudovirales phage]|uniref:Uncharacterized protein n=1 Tax=uncultured Caudovirales phage TaxID=2100421 RepID=A0A6J5P0A5_9CAUD|nr:hypothetical protein UFOVP833_39 [uncultured Caudovirales phage]CAB4218717.1 hypothetical protein UFOVP1603_49 [uncultured Caudovirales phage]
MNLTSILGVVIVVIGAGVVFESMLLKRAYERNGALETSLKTATTRLTEINNAMRDRDKVDGQNRALSDDALFDGLRQ